MKWVAPDPRAFWIIRSQIFVFGVEFIFLYFIFQIIVSLILYPVVILQALGPIAGEDEFTFMLLIM